MKHLLLLILITISLQPMFAQTEPHPCGTPAFKSDWLKEYQANPGLFNYKRETTIHVPVTIHSVGRNNGTGRISETKLLRAMCTLQQDFADTGIEFYLNGNIRTVDDSDMYEHQTVIDGGFKMFEYNEDNSINCYLVEVAAGNCGYNLPWAGVAVQFACAQPDDHTWSHELGHALSLPHPFLGWEGGISHDNSVSHNFADPAPEFVTYNYTNFKDSLILDTMIIDTALVEKMDGSNCLEAADGFCDTPPDYLAQRWPCDNNKQSFTQQTDPNGEKFKSDATLIMSYSFDNCAVRFSDEQIMAMRANALDEKGNYTSEDSIFPALADPVEIELLRPFSSEMVYYENVEFEWDTDTEDQYYLFQLGVEPTFSLILYDTIVDKKSLTLKEADRTWGDLYWRVRPFTANVWCTGYSAAGSFVPSETSTVTHTDPAVLRIYPTIMDSQRKLFIERDHPGTDLVYALYDLQGRQYMHGTTQTEAIELDNSLNPGMYFISFFVNGERVVRRIIIN